MLFSSAALWQKRYLIKVESEIKTGKKDKIISIILSSNNAYQRSGKWDSAVVTYEYTFINEIPVPTGEELIYNMEQQIGVSGNPFYTIEAVEGSCVTIDEDGNATAVNAGTYSVRLKLRDGFVWKIENDPDDPEDDSTSEEDHTFVAQWEKTESNDKKGDSPGTGDSTQILLWIVLLCISIAAHEGITGYLHRKV